MFKVQKLKMYWQKSFEKGKPWLEQLTLDETEQFVKDVRDCMSCVGMFPPVLDLEAKQRILVAKFPGLVRLFKDIIYIVAKESFQRSDLEMLMDNILKAKKANRPLKDAVAATHWHQARKYAFQEQWDTLTAELPEDTVKPTEKATASISMEDEVQENTWPERLQMPVYEWKTKHA